MVVSLRQEEEEVGDLVRVLVRRYGLVLSLQPDLGGGLIVDDQRRGRLIAGGRDEA